MPQDLDKPHRRSIRLRGYDYRHPNAYFVTICTHNHECLLATISDGQSIPNEFGLAAITFWNDLPGHYPYVELDSFIVMPNHVHGILVLLEDPASASATNSIRALPRPQPLSEIVRAFKTFSARAINRMRTRTGVAVWQRNYYEHIIRNEDELERIRRYIEFNPGRWEEDEENLQRR